MFFQVWQRCTHIYLPLQLVILNFQEETLWLYLSNGVLRIRSMLGHEVGILALKKKCGHWAKCPDSDVYIWSRR